MRMVPLLRVSNLSRYQAFPRLISTPKVSLQPQHPRFPYCHSRAASAFASAPVMDPKISEIISYWFDKGHETWYNSPPGMDEEIRTKFGNYIDKARSTEIDHWADSPQGALALILLLDQFPRNIFRGSGESFSSDHKAKSIATVAIAQRYDRELGKNRKLEQMFFYLPLMHAEDLCSQIACIALYENLAASCEADTIEKKVVSDGLGFAQRHAACILQLGRFPKRNEAIGRESTAEEKKYLEQNPAGF